VKPTSELDHSLQRIVSRLKCAIESEQYDEALLILSEYRASVTSLCEGDAAPSQEEVVGLMNWALQTLRVAQAHAIDRYQLLSDSRIYSSGPDPERKTWRLTL
jgi:hypothetical protein